MLRGVAGFLLILGVPMVAAGEAVRTPPFQERVAFTPNLGQFPADVDFGAATQGIAISLSRHGLSFIVADDSAPVERRHRARSAHHNTTFSMKLHGGSLEARSAAVDPLPGLDHFYSGNDPAAWRTGVPRYGRVVYQDVYPGIDLAVYGKDGQVEYDFVVRPGARPEDIDLEFGGARTVEVTAAGDVLLTAESAHLRHAKPVLYQDRNGAREIVEGRYVRSGDGHVGFELGTYDPTRPLVIDPTVVYSVSPGGVDIAVDASGMAYVCRSVPAAGGDNVAVTQVSPDGVVLGSVVLGGSGDDDPYAVAADAAGNVYVVGQTRSLDFPNQPGVIGTPHQGSAFVAKIERSGSLAYSTYVGGLSSCSFTAAFGVAVDAGGRAYVTGANSSNSFPTTANAYQRTKTTDECFFTNAFMAVLNPAATALDYSTYLGGTIPVFSPTWRGTEDDGFGIALGPGATVAVTGITGSRDFPISSPTVYRATNPTDDFDAFVTMFDITRSGPASLVYSTFLGGTEGDQGSTVAVDGSGNAYVAGYTGSTDTFQGVTSPIQPASGGGRDGFIAKLDPSGSALLFATYFGGGGRDEIWGLGLDAQSNPIVTGSSQSATVPGVATCATSSQSALLLVKVSAVGDRAIYSSCQHHTVSDFGLGLDYRDGSLYVTGSVTLRLQDAEETAIEILPSTTRWRPQRDTARDADGNALNSIKIEFTSARPLKSATVTITGPSAVPPITETFDPANPPNPYVVEWNGFATDAAGNVSYLNRGDYTVTIRGVKEDDSTTDSDPNARCQGAPAGSPPCSTISLVEVTKVELCQADESEGCFPLTTPYPGVSADNPPVGTLPGQDPPQDRLGAGKRIFAEATTRNGPTENRVKVRATTDPVLPADSSRPTGALTVPVYFKSLDVDDPAPADPAAKPVPGKPGLFAAADLDNDQEADVLDNRGSPKEGLVEQPIIELSASQTKARTFFQTSLQPGDNYRVTASTSQLWLNGLLAVQASPNGEVTVTAEEKQTNISEMLTVWRTLHLEIDAMEAPPNSKDHVERNFLEGRVLAIEGDGMKAMRMRLAETSFTSLGLADRSADLDGTYQRRVGKGRFERGTVRLGIGADAIVIADLDGNGERFVQKNAGISIPFQLQDAQGGNPVTGTVIAWDADPRRPQFTVSSDIPVVDYTDGTFRIGGVSWNVVVASGDVVQVGERDLPFHLVDDDLPGGPLSPSYRLLQADDDPAKNLLAQAYIRPAYDLGNPRPVAPFNRNISSPPRPDGARSDQDFYDQAASVRDNPRSASNAYWVGYAQFAYQADETVDEDPGSERDAHQGETSFVGGDISFVFSAVIEESARNFGGLAGNDSTQRQLLFQEAMRLCPGKVLAHEVGHQLGVDDVLAEQRAERTGIMIMHCAATTLHFMADELALIRSKGVSR